MALHLASNALGFTPALAPGAARPNVVAPSPTMMAKSKALPFLEAPAHLDGSMAGDVGFDPFGFGSAYSLKYMREAELKHGRICMLAVMGYISVDCGFYAPGAPHVSSLLAHDVTVKSGHMLLLLFTVGIMESLSYGAIYEMLSGESDRAPGDYGFDPFNYSKDVEKAPKYAEQELAHCRAAMLGFGGIVTQSAMFDVGFPYY
jgi:hypothetical protein